MDLFSSRPPVNEALIGGVVSARVSVCVAVVSLAAEGKAAGAPRDVVVIGLMGFLKALKNAGVPNVSVRAIPRTLVALVSVAASFRDEISFPPLRQSIQPST